MNIMDSGYLYTYGNVRQAEVGNRALGHKSAYKGMAEMSYEDTSANNTNNAGISVMDAYESMGARGKLIPEAEQGAVDGGKSDTEKIEEKVIDIEVVSLFEEGVNFNYNTETGEVSCVKFNSPVSGGQVLWNKVLSPEEMLRCDALFENYPNYSKGYFEFQYRAYLPHEEFWDMYLEGKVDLEKLKQREGTCSNAELFDKFLQDMRMKTE